MRIPSIFLGVLALAACQSSPLAPASTLFNEEMAKFKAQPFGDSAFQEYAKVWMQFNNENSLDEKDDCYSKASGQVRLVILVDETGTVRNVATDIENAKATCFKESYMNVRFPPPPFPSFRQALNMQ